MMDPIPTMRRDLDAIAPVGADVVTNVVTGFAGSVRARYGLTRAGEVAGGGVTGISVIDYAGTLTALRVTTAGAIETVAL